MTTISLSAPVTKGNRTITELKFQDPVTRHILACDGKAPESAAFVVAMASSMTGEPELLLQELLPEDWVKVRTEVKRAYGQFLGFNAAQMAALIAQELTEDEMREVIKTYAKINRLKPEQLLPMTPQDGAENPTTSPAGSPSTT